VKGKRASKTFPFCNLTRAQIVQVANDMNEVHSFYRKEIPVKAFVTGSTGLLGNNLVRLLVKQGYDVKALARSRLKAERLFSDIPVTIVLGDMQDVSQFASELDGCDVLFHTAAFFRDYYQPGNHWKALWETNVQGTIALLTAAEQHGVKKVIYVSSSSVIGAGPGNAPGDESTPADAKQLKNLYSKSKALAEEAIDTFLTQHTLPVVLILPTAMFGPGDIGPTGTGRMVQDFLSRKIPGIVDGGLSVVDARDIAQIMLTAVEKGKSGERYIAGAGYLTMADILAVLEKFSGVPAPTRHIPYAATLAYATVLEWVGQISRRPVLVSRESVRILHTQRRVSADKAKRELAATFRPFEQTIQDEVAWYRTHQLS